MITGSCPAQNILCVFNMKICIHFQNANCWSKFSNILWQCKLHYRIRKPGSQSFTVIWNNIFNSPCHLHLVLPSLLLFQSTFHIHTHLTQVFHVSRPNPHSELQKMQNNKMFFTGYLSCQCNIPLYCNHYPLQFDFKCLLSVFFALGNTQSSTCMTGNRRNYVFLYVNDTDVQPNHDLH